ncbi:hypothetical protein [Shimia marina]|uniref:hypothetical protein n=1 Tax=Shimia marina TaxID=321267 RepID=UPI001187313B|nr:hypothetical protein [Shimia marina]
MAIFRTAALSEIRAIAQKINTTGRWCLFFGRNPWIRQANSASIWGRRSRRESFLHHLIGNAQHTPKKKHILNTHFHSQKNARGANRRAFENFDLRGGFRC